MEPKASLPHLTETATSPCSLTKYINLNITHHSCALNLVRYSVNFDVIAPYERCNNSSVLLTAVMTNDPWFMTSSHKYQHFSEWMDILRTRCAKTATTWRGPRRLWRILTSQSSKPDLPASLGAFLFFFSLCYSLALTEYTGYRT
jgi:hypothetical protein